MNTLMRIWAIFVVAVKRVFSNWGLVIAILTGMVTSIALTMSIPLYAETVYYNIFQEGVATENVDTGRPPFAFFFRYVGSWYGPLAWEEIQQVDEYLTESVTPALRLPQQLFVRHISTKSYRVYAEDETVFGVSNEPLFWSPFTFISDLQSHIRVLEGEFPAVTEANEDRAVEVLVSEPLALNFGLQVGETYLVYITEQTQTGEEISKQIPFRVAGVWQPKDSQEDYWFVDPMFLESDLLIPEGSYLGYISPLIAEEVNEISWYYVLDGSDVRYQEAGSLAARIRNVQQRAVVLLPELRLEISPYEELVEYQRVTRLLTILLYAFSVPVIGLIMAFISLIAGLVVERQRNEIAVLRSRGSTLWQVLGIVFLENLLFGAVAVTSGAPVGMQIARVMGRTRSFLDFAVSSELNVSLTVTALRLGMLAFGLALLAQIVPALGAARQTIVSYKQGRARMIRPPWWQRAWLDVLLFIPAAYGIYLLRSQGSLVLLESSTEGEPFQNPLLFLVPALSIFAVTLFMLRLIPPCMRLIAWVAARTKSVGLLMASRHLARTPGSYATPLILLVLTLSLSAFTASLAQTLDNHLYDQFYYRIGADMTFTETGMSDTPSSPFAQMFSGTDEPADEAVWFFVPVTEYLEIPWVQAAARLGRYKVTPQLADQTRQDGLFYGVDRLDFPRVAFWRRDFSTQSLGALMNALALAPDGVLTSRQFLRTSGLKTGDTLRLDVNIYGQRYELVYRIVGAFDYFPSWYPEEDGPLFVGNLEYLFEQVGNNFPYRVWLDVQDGLDIEQMGEIELAELNMRVTSWNSPQPWLARAERRPERQGLFGLLSVGFAAAALLTVAGFLIYSLFSFRRRFIELGVLRAIGLSPGQMTSYLAWELIFFMLIGGGAGTVLGVWASQLFTPYLQIGYGEAARVPPFVVEIAWPEIYRIYALFGLLFLVTLVVLVLLLRRMKIFQAIKLGETV